MAKMTVCGGGNAAHVLIALGRQAGWEVDVFAPLAGEAQRLSTGQGIVAQAGDRPFSGVPRWVSADAAEVIPGSELVLLALPAFAHGAILGAISGYLDPHASVGAFPARGGFDYQAHNLLDVEQLSLTIFGLQTLPWACRITEYGRGVEILGTKTEVVLTASPSHETQTVVTQLTFIPDVKFTTVSSFLALSLANTGQLIHPGIMYGLCHGQEDKTFSGKEIPLFYQNVNAATAQVLESLSEEVQAIADSLAHHFPAFKREEVVALYDWLLRAYCGDIEDSATLERAFVTNRSYAGLRIPVRSISADTYRVDFGARYLSEDVPFGLVVVRGIAELAGVATPMIDQVVLWAQQQLGRIYLQQGKIAGADVAHTRAPQVYGIESLEQLARVSWQANHNARRFL